MRGWGIPSHTIRKVRDRVREMWSDTAGSWAWEWTREAESAKRAGDPLLAARLYGAARFPCAVSELQRAAARHQLESYLAAAPSFPCRFERRVLELSYRGRSTRVPTHLFAVRGDSRHKPLLCLSGGVDTLKMELHRLALTLVRLGGFRVAAIDMPGTGESELALAPDADTIYEGVLDELAGEAQRGVLGISFGGHWAAKLGLRRCADAAVDLGGPIGAGSMNSEKLARLPNGMTGILGNALRLTALPGENEAGSLLRAFSLREQGLLQGARATALLAVNGAHDQYVPREDTTVFRSIPGAEVWLVEGATHCAAERFPAVVLSVIAWLRVKLLGASAANRALLAASLAVLRPAR